MTDCISLCLLEYGCMMCLKPDTSSSSFYILYTLSLGSSFWAIQSHCLFQEDYHILSVEGYKVSKKCSVVLHLLPTSFTAYF